MDIKDFKNRREELNKDLFVAINDILKEFQEETGYHPKSISCQVLENNPIGGVLEYDLIGVFTEIKL